MNWRRGLLLAGMNILIVILAFVWQDARFWLYTNIDVANRLGARVKPVVFQEEIVVRFDPCEWYDLDSLRLEEVAGLAKMPIALLTGWHGGCLTRSSLGRVIRRVIGARNHFAEVADCVCLSVLVCIEWVLVGGLPLVRLKHWWLEPGAFITAVALLGGALALIPITYPLARVAEILASLGWLWWFGLLLWIPIHKAGESTVGGLRRLTH